MLFVPLPKIILVLARGHSYFLSQLSHFSLKCFLLPFLFLDTLLCVSIYSVPIACVFMCMYKKFTEAACRSVSFTWLVCDCAKNTKFGGEKKLIDKILESRIQKLANLVFEDTSDIFALHPLAKYSINRLYSYPSRRDVAAIYGNLIMLHEKAECCSFKLKPAGS